METLGFSLGEGRDFLSRKRQRELETLADTTRFEQLFQMAQDIYLSKPLPDIEHQPDTSPETQLITQLGTRGLRSAYEISEKIEQPPKDMEGALSLLPHTLPDLFSDSIDRNALEKAHQLGAAMSEEMFAILGSDAPEAAELFRQASSDDEQMAILSELLVRIQAITDAKINTEEIADSDAQTTYSPIRLSAKALGIYPDHRATPTCLGTTIAAAGFLAHAGARYLHAGVMESYQNYKVRTAARHLSIIPGAVERLYGEPANPLYNEGISKTVQEMRTDTAEHRGYHACLLIQLHSGAWALFDPNFNTLARISDEETPERKLRKLTYQAKRASRAFLKDPNDETEKDEADDEDVLIAASITKAADFLESMKDSAPGLELSQSLGEKPHVSTAYMSIIRKLQPVSHETIRKKLLEDEADEATITSLFHVATANFPPLKSEYVDQHTRLYNLFSKQFVKYVLDGMPIDTFLLHCRSDSYFLDRAVTTIRQLPCMALASEMLQALSVESTPINAPHPYVEIGLPDIRIGLAALSDLATFTNTSPSPSFWLSNWPSLIPVTEAVHLDAPQQSQQEHLFIHNYHVLQKSLRYDHSYGKVTGFLQAHHQEEREHNGQDQSEEARGTDGEG